MIAHGMVRRHRRSPISLPKAAAPVRSRGNYRRLAACFKSMATKPIRPWPSAGGKSNVAPMRLAFCLAHARRKFVDVVKLTGSSEALSILARIAEIYRIEAKIRGESADTRLRVRRREQRPS